MKRKNQNGLNSAVNAKPYIVVGVGALVLIVSIYQIVIGAPGNLVDEYRYDDSKEIAGDEEEDQLSVVVENIDTDSDGLTDTEEEQIYRTSPVKPDTDDDGFSDGLEVQNGYDPLVANSDVVVADSGQGQSSYQQYNKLNIDSPDKLQDLDPTNYLSEQDLESLKNGDTPNDIEALSSLALANIAITTDEVLPDIDDSEINIIEATGKAAVQQYVFSVGSIFFQYAPFVGEDDAMSYLQALAGGDSSRLAESKRLAEQGLKELKQVRVPREAVDIHKRAMGALEVFTESSDQILTPGVIDPQKGIEAANNLRIVTQAVDGILQDVFALTGRYGISFGF